jgi:transcriptional regulator with XRE-family HTH domain
MSTEPSQDNRNSIADRHDSFGARIKSHRKRTGITARELAERLGVSASLISKIERDAANPSFDVLRRLAFELRISVGDLIDEVPVQPPGVRSTGASGRAALVRADERKVLRLPNSGREYQLLTPHLRVNAELVWIEEQPGRARGGFMSHEGGQESILVLEGILTVEVGGESFQVTKGDCLTFDSLLPHRYHNETSEKVIVIYVAAPPTL